MLSSKFPSVFLCIFSTLLILQASAFSPRSSSFSCRRQISQIQQLPPAFSKKSMKLFILPDAEGETNPLVAVANSKVQGYMSSDLSSNEDGKQGRVFGYILFALVPVLFLVPFFLSRGFEPPVDPDMAPITAISSAATTNALKERIY